MSSILVVDDSPIDRRLVAGLLGHVEGWRVRVANDGSDGLVAVSHEIPDVVITDLQMPELNGLELVSAIRRKYPEVPVVLMTAQGSEEIAMETLRIGAASYVPKRILAAELVPTIRRVLAQAQDDRNLAALMNRMQSREDAYRLECDLSLMLTLSRHLQQQLGAAWQLDKAERLRLGTAIEEALLNAHYHGNLEVDSSLKEEDFDRFYALAEERLQQSPYKERMVDVRLQISPVVASITIRDQGRGFDPTTLPDPRDGEYLDRPCGRGVMLMRSFMDDVRYNATGNEVTLVKRRFSKTIS